MAKTELRHNEAIQRNTGWGLEPSLWVERQQRRVTLRHQSDRLATLLEAAGVVARREATVTAIGLVTGQMKELDAWRSIRFIPEVAARDRRPMLNAFKKWVKTEGGQYIRYGVVTGGDLIPAFGSLKDAMADMKRRVSKWASWAKKEYDVEVVFRGVEYTRKRGDEEIVDNETGELLPALCVRNPDLYQPHGYYYNCHCNVAYRPRRFLKDADWKSFLERSWVRLGAHWKDNGKLTKPEELVKYIFKGNDLRDIEAEEAAWLQSETFNQRDMQPLGSFRDYMAGLRRERQKVVSVQGSLTVVQKAKRLDHSKKAVEAAADDEGEAVEASTGSGRPARNIILGVTMPQWEWTPWAEPTALVQHYEPDAVGKAAEAFREEMAVLRQMSVDDWRKAGAPEPEVALTMAQAWKDEQSAATVVAFRRGTEGVAEGQPYRVHTDRLTVHGEDSTTEGAVVSPTPIGKGKAGGPTSLREPPLRSKERRVS